MAAESNNDREDNGEAVADVGSDVAAAASGAGIGLIGGTSRRRLASSGEAKTLAIRSVYVHVPACAIGAVGDGPL